MFSKKDFILSNINMKEVLSRYGIKVNRDMFCCPFHKDNYPSAKCYEATYFCFGCGKGGDLIQFVQDYYNLNFVSAMEKINIDFDLKIPRDNKISKKELKEIEEKRRLELFLKKEKERKRRETLIHNCEYGQTLERTIKLVKDSMTPYNWEETELMLSFLEQELELLNEEFKELINKSDY